MSKFMQSYNYIKNKHSNEKDKELEKTRVKCQRLHSYFHHMGDDMLEEMELKNGKICDESDYSCGG